MKKILLLLVVMLVPMLASADAVEIDGIYYNLKGDIAAVTKNPKLYEGEIIIPSSVSYEGNVYSVTTISDHAFADCKYLRSVTVPNTVMTIDDCAFYRCIYLNTIILPDNMTSIGQSAFVSCEKLTSIKIPSGVTSIKSFTFMFCKSLTSIVIPNTVTSIGGMAFSGCESLSSITIPSDVTSIGTSAFKRCTSLTSISIPIKLSSLQFQTFEGCTELTSITIPYNMKSIGEGVFLNCSKLSSVTIGSGVTTIGNKAFGNCPELTDITCLAKNVPNTQNNAFEGSFIEYATLHVPTESIDSYKQNAPWYYFKDIVAIESSSVESIQDTKFPIIKSEGGMLTVEGVSDNEIIDVFTLNGMHRGSAVSQKGIAHFKTNLKTGNVAIVKIGNKSFKVVIQ